MTSQSPVRVRFAPSPTGFLHIGGVRTALFNYLFAKKHGGTFILRLEDTDRERFVESGITQISEVLNWLCILPDEGYWEGEHNGDVGPYIQSQRLPRYDDFAQKLIDMGVAYRSYIAPDDFQKNRQTAIDAKKPFVYRRSMEPQPSEQSSKVPIRLDILALQKKLATPSIVWADAIRGKFELDWSIVDDFILVKADGFPTYNFANIIDDHLMQISHVLRGDEFISSTAKHAILYDALGLERPIWAHLPLILGSDGAKLSKRHGDTDALQYREKGYLPEAILNFLAQLGWNDGTEQEIFSLEEMVQKFNLERIQKSPAKFDVDRLDWMNGIFIREKLSEQDYINRALAELPQANLANTALAQSAVLLERERIKTFKELPELVDFFFTRPKNHTEIKNLIIKKASLEEASKIIAASIKSLSELTSSDMADIETQLRDSAQEQNIKAGQMFYVIRVAITGKTAAPGLFETISTLSVEETIERLKIAQEELN
jgi:glutamyl-tRNA synthetase